MNMTPSAGAAFASDLRAAAEAAGADVKMMVAPPFVPECIKPTCLAHRNEGEATPTTTVGILLSYMVDTLPHWFFDHQ